MNKQDKSSCCNADVTVEGNTTKHYVCSKCGNACDLGWLIKKYE